MSIFGIPSSGKSYTMQIGKQYRCSFDFKPVTDVASIKLIGVDEATNMDKWITDKKEKKTMFFKKLRKRVDEIHHRVFRKYDEGYGFGIIEEIRRLRDDVNKLLEKETIDCHTCGCVVRKEIAFRGNDRIEREELTHTFSTLVIGGRVERDVPPTYEEVTHETWYCKLHKRGKKAYGSK